MTLLVLTGDTDMTGSSKSPLFLLQLPVRIFVRNTEHSEQLRRSAKGDFRLRRAEVLSRCNFDPALAV
jgi:hypothetical protein